MLHRMRRHDEVLGPALGCEDGVRLQIARGARLDCLDLPSSPEHAVVLGTHEACSFRVDAGEAIANRQALLIPSQRAGVRSLEVIDLRRRRTPTGLIGDEQPCEETVVRWPEPEQAERPRGDVLMRIVGLPGRDEQELRREPIEVRFIRAQKLAIGSLELGTEVSPPVDFVGTSDGAGEHDPCVAQIVLFRAGLCLTGWLRASALRKGVLIRRERQPEVTGHNRVGQLLARLTARLSRAHALLRQESEGLVIYDLDSSPGSFLGAERIRRLVLPPDRVRIKLGSSHSGLWLELMPRTDL